MGRTIDADKLCADLMELWDIADKQKEELVRHVMADIVTPIVVSQPTVEPERKKGKWIPLFDGMFTGGAYWFRCSKCERIVPDVRNGGWNFCPNCGADMREDQDG